ncbi:MAG: PBP1A family penicillin-binding protein [Clostridia bacterium]|nr:PBP1A family penicillin-binding protein [Clostridia bacterium]
MAKKKSGRKRKKSILTRALMALGVTLGIIVIAVVGLVVGSLLGYVEDAELIDVENMRLNLTSFVYAEDPDSGETIEVEQLYDTENRIWATSSEIPEHLKNAFVAIEDERFYSHFGVDLKRFMGAAIQYITKKGNSSYGGSTITQQLIKNLTRDDEYSIKRKIQEIYRAFNLERDLSKEEILEYYLNTIYLSQKCNGVASAALTYFGKEVSDLSLAECAVLAGITQFPTKYDPLVNPENNRARQLVILKKMKQLGFITDKEYEEAVDEKLVFVKKDAEGSQNYQSYFTDAAIDQVIEDLMEQYNYTKEYASKILYNGGLQIYLSMDMKMQEAMDKVYNDPSAFQKASTAVQPQSSMVIMDPYTGLVKALSGGRGEKEGNRTLNRATHTLRQPGSTIKPLSVYAPAVEYGLVTPSSIVNDSPVSFGEWKPRNDDRSFKGRITVAAALRGSRNVPAVKICNYLTPDASFDFVKNNLHVSTLVKKREKNGKVFSDVALAPITLGGLTDGVSVLEMCAAYCTFPNGGKYIKPSLYTKVVDSDGKVILEHKAKEQIAMSESTAESVISMLTDAVNGGTGTAARLSGMRVAGKTGTTSSNNDRWFVGFTPYYVGAVWFGYDEPATLRGFSPNPAAVAWRKVMAPIHEGLENKKFLADEEKGTYSVMLCAESKMRATPSCRKLTSKRYKKSEIPTKLCTSHPYEFNENDLAKGSAEVVEKNEQVEGVIEMTPEGEAVSPDTPNSSVTQPTEPSVTPAPESVTPSQPAPAPSGGNAGLDLGI